MDLPATATSESLGKIDFDIHGMVRIRLIDPSPSDLSAAHKLLGCPSRLPVTNPEITVRFVEDLSASGIRFLGDDRGFTDDGFFLLQEGTRRVKARIPFDRIGDSCEIVCRSQIESVPLLMPIVGLTALKKGYIPLHAAAVVYDSVGLLMAGWAHCGKTTALLGFASEGAEYVGEEWVLFCSNDQRMYGLVRPLELAPWHLASLSQVRGAVSLMNRCAFRGIDVLHGLQKMIRGERIRSSFAFRSLQRASMALGDRLRQVIPLSAIFRDKVCCTGAPADKIFLFLNQEDQRIDVERITPFEMAARLTFLVQHELSALQRHYTAYRFAFPSRRNEFIESSVEYSLAILARGLLGRETYIVRLPYPHVFPELFNAIQLYCNPTTAATAAESIHALV